jgi:DNA-binding transcriptional LysR family regulator
MKLLEQLEKYYMPLQRTLDTIREVHDVDKVMVRIGVARDETVPPEMMKVIQAYNLHSTRLHIPLVEQSHSELLPGLLHEEYDMVVSTDKSMLEMQEISAHALRKYEMYLAVCKNHPLSMRETLHPSELGDTVLFFPTPNANISSLEFHKIMRGILGADLIIRMSASPSDALNCAQAAAGCAAVPDLVRLDAYPDLKLYRYEEPKDSSLQYLFWRSDEQDPYILSVIDDICKNTQSGEAKPNGTHTLHPS